MRWVAMELQYSAPFGEQYRINIQAYGETSIVDLPFSIRVTSRLQHHKIITIADLLKTSPDELMHIKGFGKKCLDEIDHVFTDIQNETDSGSDILRNGCIEGIISRYAGQIFAGDFSFEHYLSDAEKAYIEEIKKAYDCLDPSLVVACSENQLGMQRIIEMLAEGNYYFDMHRWMRAGWTQTERGKWNIRDNETKQIPRYGMDINEPSVLTFDANGYEAVTFNDAIGEGSFYNRIVKDQYPWSKAMLLYPVPYNEMQKSQLLVQNPLWN